MLQQYAAKKIISLIPKKQETLLTVAGIFIYAVEFVSPLYHHLQSIITHAGRYGFLSWTKIYPARIMQSLFACSLYKE